MRLHPHPPLVDSETGPQLLPAERATRTDLAEVDKLSLMPVEPAVESARKVIGETGSSWIACDAGQDPRGANFEASGSPAPQQQILHVQPQDLPRFPSKNHLKTNLS